VLDHVPVDAESGAMVLQTPLTEVNAVSAVLGQSFFLSPAASFAFSYRFHIIVI